MEYDYDEYDEYLIRIKCVMNMDMDQYRMVHMYIMNGFTYF